MPSPRKKRSQKSQPTSLGTGSKVSEEELVRAATIWLELEAKSDSGKVSALAVGRRLGKAVAPEWLGTPRFLMSLELVRFNRKVAELKGVTEISALVQRVTDLGLIEAHRRLVMEPSTVPDTVLFGDVLHKLIKMQQELTAGAKPIKAGDVYQIVAREINLLADPREQALLRRQIMGTIESGLKMLQASGPSNAEESIVDVVGVEPTPQPDAVPVPGLPAPGTGEGGSSNSDPSGDSLWSDPALD